MTPGERKNIGLLSFEELVEYNKTTPASFVIDGLLQEGSLNIAVGDSGEGKTPLAYQMCLCVCTGKPFLGRQVTQGPAIYIDLENGPLGIEEVGTSLCKYLKCDRPGNLYIMTERHPKLLGQILSEIKPKLVIIDSLRAYEPEAEKTEKVGGILNELRSIARKNNVAIVFIHHIRKPKEDNVAPTPMNQSVIEMLNRACGARALVNQTDTRIIFPGENKPDGAALVMWWNIRLRGQFGPTYIERCLDESGDPLGYRQMCGINLLSAGARDAWHKLPQEFTFGEAKRICGKKDQPMSNILRKCQQAGIIEQPVKKGPYRKVEIEDGGWQPQGDPLDGAGKLSSDD